MPKLLALLIGINEYHDPIYQLEGCVNDVQAVKKFLQKNYDNEKIQLVAKELIDKEATRENIIKGFSLFEEAEEGDYCVLYYSGHGSRVKAPEEFWHQEPSKMLRSVVCHDSRKEGGKDLLNKEISYLIWKAMKDKENVHFVSIMDCCFSGFNTRLFKENQVKTRMYKPNLSPVKLEDFLGFESFDLSERRLTKAPVGKHIALSASKTNEPAKETYLGNERRGVFTYSLLEILEQKGRNITYTDLIHLAGIKIGQYFPKQKPLVDFVDTHPKTLFLGGIGEYSKQYYLYYQINRSWLVNVGKIHGIGIENEGRKTSFRLTETGQEIELDELGLFESKVEPSFELDKKKTYSLEPQFLATKKLAIGLDDNVDEGIVQDLKQILLEEPSQKFEWTNNKKDAKYVMLQGNGKIGLAQKGERRFLFNENVEETKVFAKNIISNIEKIASWESILTLGSTNETAVAPFEAELFRLTEAGNYEDGAAAKKVEVVNEVELSYSYQGEKWHNPAFRCRLKNNSSRELWFAAVFLGARYEIHELLAGRAIQRDEELWLEIPMEYSYTKTFKLEVHDKYLTKGITTITDYLKIIVSNRPLDFNLFNQEGLDWEEYLKSFRSISFKSYAPKDAWFTKLINLKIKRPLNSHTEESSLFKQFGLQLAAEGNTPKVTLFTIEDAFEEENKIHLHLHDSGKEVVPFELTDGYLSSSGLSVLSFFDFKDTKEISETNPLIIHFENDKVISEDKTQLVPLKLNEESKTFDVLPHKWKGNALELYQMPAFSKTNFKDFKECKNVILGIIKM
ncbi:MAG: caspase family protein [Bacteroidota bacterium]